jgi:hypothetical protein
VAQGGGRGLDDNLANLDDDKDVPVVFNEQLSLLPSLETARQHGGPPVHGRLILKKMLILNKF